MFSCLRESYTKKTSKKPREAVYEDAGFFLANLISMSFRADYRTLAPSCVLVQHPSDASKEDTRLQGFEESALEE